VSLELQSVVKRKIFFNLEIPFQSLAKISSQIFFLLLGYYECHPLCLNFKRKYFEYTSVLDKNQSLQYEKDNCYKKYDLYFYIWLGAFVQEK